MVKLNPGNSSRLLRVVTGQARGGRAPGSRGQGVIARITRAAGDRRGNSSSGGRRSGGAGGYRMP